MLIVSVDTLSLTLPTVSYHVPIWSNYCKEMHESHTNRCFVPLSFLTHIEYKKGTKSSVYIYIYFIRTSSNIQKMSIQSRAQDIWAHGVWNQTGASPLSFWNFSSIVQKSFSYFQSPFYHFMNLSAQSTPLWFDCTTNMLLWTTWD